MKTVPPWKRNERWLAFVLTFLGICSFLAIVPVSEDPIVDSVETEAEVDLLATGTISFLDSLREGASGVQSVGHWTSLLPPLVAIMVAVFFRSMLGALISAFVVGSFLAYGLNPIATGILGVNDFLIQPSVSQFSVLIILFLLTLIGMVHVIAKSGGLAAMVAQLRRIARGRRRVQLTVMLGGLLIFFDDYSNSVVLGTTMRKLSDAFRISREKLAYIVDTTTAPVAGLALLSTWVAFEALLLGEVAEKSGVPMTGYAMLIEMLPMRFYCIGALMFLFISIVFGRDFGPMYRAEKRAFAEGKLVADDSRIIGNELDEEVVSGEKGRWYNAAIPVGVVLFSIVFGILWLGESRLSAVGRSFGWLSFEDWRSAFGAAAIDPSGGDGPGVMAVMLIASLIGGVIAIVLPLAQRLLTLKDAARSYLKAFPTLWTAIFILAMTWSMRAICETLGTADYLLAMTGDTVPLWMLPLLSFLLAAGMSFTTGTSWGAMGILIPILVPLSVEMGALENGNALIFILTASAILDGSIFGDHCSPISDTTVLSSVSSGCDHIDHVNTQFYYAFVTALFCGVLGYVAVGQGLPLWFYYVAFPISAMGLFFYLGKPVERVSTEETAVE